MARWSMVHAGRLNRRKGLLSTKHGCKKSAELTEKSTPRRRVGRCRLCARWFPFVNRRKRCAHYYCLIWTRVQRQDAHILDRRRRRSTSVEHERRFHLDVEFVRRY